VTRFRYLYRKLKGLSYVLFVYYILSSTVCGFYPEGFLHSSLDQIGKVISLAFPSFFIFYCGFRMLETLLNVRKSSMYCKYPSQAYCLQVGVLLDCVIKEFNRSILLFLSKYISEVYYYIKFIELSQSIFYCCWGKVDSLANFFEESYSISGCSLELKCHIDFALLLYNWIPWKRSCVSYSTSNICEMIPLKHKTNTLEYWYSTTSFISLNNTLLKLWKGLSKRRKRTAEWTFFCPEINVIPPCGRRSHFSFAGQPV